jgi:hypothetical protein
MNNTRPGALESGRFPHRFRAAEARNRRIGRPLQLLTRQFRADEATMTTIGESLTQRDEPAAALVQAMRIKDNADPDRVSMAQFKHALDAGIEQVPGAPAPLRDFFAVVDPVPAWVDFDLINEGARAYRRLGRNAADVLLQLALLSGYRFGGPTDLLAQTGGLTGDTARRRLAETQKWAIDISAHDAMRRTGNGFKLTVHVRLMHALVNHQFETNGRWDTARWGLPINQSDQAATLGLFSGALLLGVRALGVRVTAAESRAVMHMWKYVGWLIGVDEDWLHDTEMAQHRLNYHHLITQGDISDAGPALANAVVDAIDDLNYRWPRLQRAYTRARLLSMLSYFLGPQGMRELELPYRPPWAALTTGATNLAKYHVLARTPTGNRYLQRSSERFSQRHLDLYFGTEDADIGPLTV